MSRGLVGWLSKLFFAALCTTVVHIHKKEVGFGFCEFLHVFIEGHFACALVSFCVSVYVSYFWCVYVCVKVILGLVVSTTVEENSSVFSLI